MSITAAAATTHTTAVVSSPTENDVPAAMNPTTRDPSPVPASNPMLVGAGLALARG